MLPSHQISRRKAASELASTLGRLPLSSPLFNLREIAKQLILLEDHLFHGYKHCDDCIRKHLLTVEAFAEEATVLDEAGLYRVGTEHLAEQARLWMEKLMDAEDQATLHEVAQNIRHTRKLLVSMAHDPRGVIDRVASVYLHRQRS